MQLAPQWGALWSVCRQLQPRAGQSSLPNLLQQLPVPAPGICCSLVAFLTFLKLTVATGTLNSLILYANIVQVNKRHFFPPNRVNILTVFIAWLNLDLGIETCFYDGLTAYVQTWLQYVFPMYVWVLISATILTARHSVLLSRVIGSDPIAVLATLLLMSYTKILRIFIEVYSRTMHVWTIPKKEV